LTDYWGNAPNLAGVRQLVNLGADLAVLSIGGLELTAGDLEVHGPSCSPRAMNLGQVASRLQLTAMKCCAALVALCNMAPPVSSQILRHMPNLYMLSLDGNPIDSLERLPRFGMPR
jgi:hypothetical protein